MSTKKVFKGVINGREYSDFREFQKDFASLQDFTNYSVSSCWQTVEDEDDKLENPGLQTKEDQPKIHSAQEFYDWLTNNYLIRVDETITSIKSKYDTFEDINQAMKDLGTLLEAKQKELSKDVFSDYDKSLFKKWAKAQREAVESLFNEKTDECSALACDLDSITNDIEENREYIRNKAIYCTTGRWYSSRKKCDRDGVSLENEYVAIFSKWFDKKLETEITSKIYDYYNALEYSFV